MRIKHRYLAAAYLVILCWCSQALSADESLDDLMSGFESGNIDVNALPATGAAPPADTLTEGLTGSVALSASWNMRDHYSSNPDTGGRTDWQGLSKLRTRLNLQYDYHLNDIWEMRVAVYTFYDSVYLLRDRDRYANEVLDEYEQETDTQEVWIRGRLNEKLDLRIGRQIVNWGKADSFRVLDVLNPLDNREPGLVDIEDLRLPVTMVKADYYYDDDHWQSSFIVIPEVRFSKNPPLGSDYETSNQAGADDFKENKPEHVDDSSYAFSTSGIFSGWDVSFHAARIWRDTPYLKPVVDLTNFINPIADSTLEHSRITMLGTGANLTHGGWLLKTELAYLDGIDYTLSHPQPLLGGTVIPDQTAKKSRVDGLIGVEYFGIANTSFAVEIAHQHIVDFDNAMQLEGQIYEERDTTGLALRATHTMLNDRLDINGVIFGNFGESGGGWRVDAKYDIQDALVLTGGVIFYQQGDKPPFDTYYHNDRMFAEIKYSF